MKTYNIEILEELNKLGKIDNEIRELILNLLEYETSGGGQWKKEYMNIIENIVKQQDPKR